LSRRGRRGGGRKKHDRERVKSGIKKETKPHLRGLGEGGDRGNAKKGGGRVQKRDSNDLISGTCRGFGPEKG